MSAARRGHDTARTRCSARSLALLSMFLLPSLGGAQSVGTGSGPLSEISRSVRDGSRPVHERGRSVRDGSAGSMKSGPVRGARRVGMLSGSVSELSAGAVTTGRPMTGGGSMSENSAGAVKQEMDPSLGEQVYDLQRALAPLQARLREQADAELAPASDAVFDDAAQSADDEWAHDDALADDPDTIAEAGMEADDTGEALPQPPDDALPADPTDPNSPP